MSDCSAKTATAGTAPPERKAAAQVSQGDITDNSRTDNMPTSLAIALSAVAAGFVGSIPFSLLIARWIGGIDLRQHGSGNVGATNVARTLGARWGGVALLADVAKGALPTLALPWLLPVAATEAVHQQVLCGTMAVLGHMFPPWLGFRGGKGVATGLGVAAVLAPLATLGAALTFLAVFVISRIVSMSSILASLFFAATQLATGGLALWTRENWSLGVFCVAVPLLILIRHRTNLVRLARGEERTLEFKSRTKPPAAGDQEPP